ncbi:hypothetical protein H5410_028327 [Solanum commersonii]|uniref:Uncharacterized protein n=1 Tax=Solanum commersonii TaxID=4109 RepID=A0A9J5Z1L4_SOLCO|nr:hypothetical protein H5410_028327 [Solanum commersonii]
MTNQSSSKRKSVKKVHASTSKYPKIPKKRGRKVAPPINRPTLPMIH